MFRALGEPQPHGLPNLILIILVIIAIINLNSDGDDGDDDYIIVKVVPPGIGPHFDN